MLESAGLENCRYETVCTEWPDRYHHMKMKNSIWHGNCKTSGQLKKGGNLKHVKEINWLMCVRSTVIMAEWRLFGISQTSFFWNFVLRNKSWNFYTKKRFSRPQSRPSISAQKFIKIILASRNYCMASFKSEVIVLCSCISVQWAKQWRKYTSGSVKKNYRPASLILLIHVGFVTQ